MIDTRHNAGVTHQVFTGDPYREDLGPFIACQAFYRGIYLPGIHAPELSGV